jgi:hypothetical protein
MTRGYRWVSTTVQPDPPEAKSADDSFIDPDTGMSCHDVGGGALVCLRRAPFIIKIGTASIARVPESPRFARTCRSYRIGHDGA